jgi:hypothetical protein
MTTQKLKNVKGYADEHHRFAVFKEINVELRK